MLGWVMRSVESEECEVPRYVCASRVFASDCCKFGKNHANYELETQPNLLTRNINLQQMHCLFELMIQPQLLPHHHACRSVLLPVPCLGTSSSYSCYCIEHNSGHALVKTKP
jgi:hypothetical protein